MNDNNNSKTTASISNSSSNNIFRNTYIRYVGYANEVGESFRYQYPKLVVPSYIIAFTYCCMDAIYTGYNNTYYNDNNYHHDNNNNNTPTTSITNNVNDTTTSQSPASTSTIVSIQRKRALIGTIDTLIWQSLASVAIPGYVIHSIVNITQYTIQRPPPFGITFKVPIFYITWLPTIIGLASIPIIIHPIDHSVDYVLDHTIRTYYKQYLNNNNNKS